MSINYWLFSSVLALVVMGSAQAETWQAELKHGGAVQVDPQTHKPVLNHDGSTSTQLWNGVHKLEDGSVIIVHDGVAIPNKAMYQTWSQALPTKAAPEPNECVQLTRRVCGIQESCTNNQACGLARQLQRLWEDAPDITVSGVSGTGQKECHKGLLNLAAFPPCERDIEAPASCVRLVDRACGQHGECKAAPACDAARQLLKLAQEAHLSTTETPDGVQFVSQCQDALSNAFFTACLVSKVK